MGSGSEHGPDEPSGGDLSFIGRRLAFENSRFRVYADHIADGQGNNVNDFLVVEPRAWLENAVTGVAILPLREGDTFLLKAYRHPVSRYVLEIPRGFVEEGELPAEAALRELQEETGLLCAPGKLVPLGFIHPEPGIVAARVQLFAATECRDGGRRLSDEIGLGGGIWVPSVEIRRMLRDCEVEDASTCVALHRYLAWLDSFTSLSPDAR